MIDIPVFGRTSLIEYEIIIALYLSLFTLPIGGLAGIFAYKYLPLIKRRRYPRAAAFALSAFTMEMMIFTIFAVLTAFNLQRVRVNRIAVGSMVSLGFVILSSIMLYLRMAFMEYWNDEWRDFEKKFPQKKF